MKKALSFALAFFLFLLIPSKAFAQSCSFTITQGGESQTYNSSSSEFIDVNDFAIAVGVPITVLVDAYIPEGVNPSCEDTYVQILASKDGVARDANLGEKYGLGENIGFNMNCGQDRYRGEYTFTINQNDLVDGVLNANGIELSVKNDGDNQCLIKYELDWDNNYEKNRATAACTRPETCEVNGETGTRVCQGTLDTSGTCSLSGAHVESGEAACSQCVVCETICYAGCQGEDPNAANYATQCADPDFEPEDGNGRCEPGEGLNPTGYEGEDINVSDDCRNASSVPFEICNQLAPGDARDTCRQCSTRGGIWTAVGCIQTDKNLLLASIVTIAISLAGGVALLMILAAAFMFTTSQGDPKKTSEAKELITSAVIGLLFIIFSVSILQLIGVTIFKIPGLGG